MGHRKIIDRGACRFWAEPAAEPDGQGFYGHWEPCMAAFFWRHGKRKKWVCPQDGRNHRMVTKDLPGISVVYEHYVPDYWRQGKRFSKEDEVFWNRLSPATKEHLCVPLEKRDTVRSRPRPWRP